MSSAITRRGGLSPRVSPIPGEPVADSERIRAQALEVAAGWSAPGSPASWRLTAALFEVIAGDEILLGDLAGLPDDRLPALLASAAIAALARHSEEPVARYFPEPGHEQPPFDDGFRVAATSFIAASRAAIGELCQRRRYQMTEVGRCVQLALGIAAVTDPADGPVAQVDVGTGAGFGLRLDRYAYQAGLDLIGPPDAGLRLPVRLRGEGIPPRAALPPIACRAGVEIDPVDLHDPAACEWLIACAPPEAAALARLGAAIEVARRYPVPVFPGDAADALPEVLASLPPRMPVIVTDSYCAVFLPPARRARLAEILDAEASTRPVTWLSLDPLVPLGPDGRESVQGLPLPSWLIEDYQQNGVFAVLGGHTFGAPASGPARTPGTPGASGPRLLARAHPSGQWTQWLEHAGTGAATAPRAASVRW